MNAALQIPDLSDNEPTWTRTNRLSGLRTLPIAFTDRTLAVV